MRILLAIDGSEHSEAAVDEIARRRFPADSEVQVIAVVEPAYLGKGLDTSFYDVEAEKAAREQARAVVEKAAAKLRQMRGAANSTSRRKSSPARQRESSSKKLKRSALI